MHRVPQPIRSRTLTLSAVLLCLLSLVPESASADSFFCALADPSDPTSAYCQFKGTPWRVYVNASDQILLYWDPSLRDAVTEEVSAVGIQGVLKNIAGSVPISADPEFAELLYATILGARFTGRQVIVQLRGTNNGYLRMDRLWLE